jgi:hypothetical protein|uniref:Uncharacterized protein orf130-b n=1 Tax=Zea mays subsp. mays TaxID=381124 RepID=Q1KKD4_MAIZE|nr:hypothetical protein [Zea mays subsp. mays]
MKTGISNPRSRQIVSTPCRTKLPLTASRIWGSIGRDPWDPNHITRTRKMGKAATTRRMEIRQSLTEIGFPFRVVELKVLEDAWACLVKPKVKDTVIPHSTYFHLFQLCSQKRKGDLDFGRRWFFQGLLRT